LEAGFGWLAIGGRKSQNQAGPPRSITGTHAKENLKRKKGSQVCAHEPSVLYFRSLTESITYPAATIDRFYRVVILIQP